MKQLKDTVIATLKSKGLRVTPQRYAVYVNLLERTDHPAVDQLLQDLNQDFPISSQATIYSSLQALRSAGLVREVLLEEGVSRYDANVEPHHHFCCRGCGAIHDIAWNTFQTLDLTGLSPHLRPENYEVTVQGWCADCQDLPSAPREDAES
ncbi:Fur family transcriptional regulator [Prochlorothrix hollandica]|uniref:Transcriptional regulator n=1 Tax=Prochlorothrix hollandica PCC 9006 = CALU 1027 TaxID=317619 RepID=A0A0M2PVI1_PROHO|nr:Fur family transcriptional regulator [Prochlorothrix hollandica]KKI98693.1 transcriptional regulator [Prochlorothrix hollandica PCC 9006 = CALU 1027]